MKVLHLAAGNLYGGIETMLVTMAKEWNSVPDLIPLFGVCFDSRLAEELRGCGFVPELFGEVRASKPWTVHRARNALKQFLRANPVGAVICHSAWPLAVFGNAVRKTKSKLVLWLHDVAQPKHWVEKWARRTPPDFIICNSHFTAQSVDLIFPSVEHEVIYCPVLSPEQISKSQRDTIRAGLGARPSDVVIVMASRMQAWKGHRVLIAALENLNTANWKCWILGAAQRKEEEEYAHELSTLAGRSGISNRIKFLGDCADVSRLLQAADIYCQPNTAPEPFGIACVEALYAKLPLVVSNTGGSAEVVSDHTGLRAPVGDENAVADALNKLISDQRLRREFGEAGPARAASLCDPCAKLAELRDTLAAIE